MPQGYKTPAELVSFKWMLTNINVLCAAGPLASLRTLGLRLLAHPAPPCSPRASFVTLPADLSLDVLTLLDLSYFSRFWTQYVRTTRLHNPYLLDIYVC